MLYLVDKPFTNLALDDSNLVPEIRYYLFPHQTLFMNLAPGTFIALNGLKRLQASERSCPVKSRLLSRY